MNRLKLFYYITVLLTGAAVMMLEILGTRIASPFFGTSHFVWTAQVLVTLISMSAGYLLSERLNLVNPGRLFVLITLSAMYLVLDASFYNIVGVVLLSTDIKLGCLLFSSIVFGPPLVLLSMTFPFVTKLLVAQDGTYPIGRVSAISTFGSVIGTVLAGYVLIPLFSNQTILLATSTFLVLDGVSYFLIVKQNPLKNKKVKLAINLIFFTQVSLTILQLSLRSPGGLVSKDLLVENSIFGELRVTETSPNNRVFLNDLLMQNSYDPITKKSTSLFTYALESMAIRFSPVKNGRVLCIGMGVGLIPRRLKENGFAVDIVEINSKLIPIAKTFFDFELTDFNVFIGDGRYFINTTKEKYDVVILDAFVGDSVPTHLLSRESFLSIKRILNPGGVIAINSFGWLDRQRAMFSSSFYRTIASVFSSITAFSLGDGNVYFLAGADLHEHRKYSSDNVTSSLKVKFTQLFLKPVLFDPSLGITFTDNFNPADIMDAKNREQWRHQVAQSLNTL